MWHQNQMFMEKEIPKIDLPEEWVVGTDLKPELLRLYTDYPMRLKCEMLAFCMEGEISASVNINKIQVNANELVMLSPGSIIQIHQIEGNLKMYILGFSQEYLEHNNQYHIMPEVLYQSLMHPKLTLKPAASKMLEEYFLFLIKVYRFMDEKMRKEVTPNIYKDAHTCLTLFYKDREITKTSISKSEQICRNFVMLVFHHYAQTRNVAWYAEKLGITHTYLCTVVKQVTEHTCVDIISYMVIMNAKSQLKLTDLSIQAISDSLNFSNMSFFGKYFKRYTGMSPLEYRDKR